jgi:hypothetical protein
MINLCYVIYVCKFIYVKKFFYSIVANERAEIETARKMEAKSGKAPSFTRFLDLDEVTLK